STAVITPHIPLVPISCPLWSGSGHLVSFEEIGQNH
ncbi:MAG: hypothetical protein ACI9FB_003858, partial [Candidatus Azotimanducaceae bacterium]